jgi:hypothetical protein
MKKTKSKKTKPEETGHVAKKTSKKLQPEADADREAVLDEREKLQRLFPPAYSADIGVWSGDKVEVMLNLTYSQAVNLARLLKENKL